MKDKSNSFSSRYVFLILGLLILAVGIGLVVNCILDANNSSSTLSSVDIDNGDQNINWSRYDTKIVELEQTLEINESGTYELFGEITDGMVKINVDNESGKVRLVLNDVSITNSNGPAIYASSGDEVVIEAASGTINTLVDSKTYSGFDEDVNAAIYSKADLTFSGDGKLVVNGNYQDGIVGKDDLTFRSGKYSVTAADDAIRGKDSVHIVDGDFDISSKMDGIKSTNDEDKTKGFVYIENGNINISADDDGIHATTIACIDNGTINIAKSYEGLEGAKVLINGGTIEIVSTDDGINAAGGSDSSAMLRPGAQKFSENLGDYSITINGGNVYVNAAGDGIDSNGSIYVNGGKIVVDGPVNSANGALDYESELVMNGGELIAVGASGMAETASESSLVNNVSIYFTSQLKAETKIEIRDSESNILVTHYSAKSFNHMSVGSENFVTGKSYSVYINDELYESFTISSTITTVGASNRGVNGGAQQDQRFRR